MYVRVQYTLLVEMYMSRCVVGSPLRPRSNRASGGGGPTVHNLAGNVGAPGGMARQRRRIRTVTAAGHRPIFPAAQQRTKEQEHDQ